jgi:hypothetical protein
MKADLKIQLNDTGWEASCYDSGRFYSNLPAPSILDRYRFGYLTHHFRRVNHSRH